MTTPTQDRVGRIVNVLLAYRGMSASALAAELGMSRQRFSDRMTGRAKFTLDEAEAMAQALGVGPGVWFDEPEAVMAYLEGGTTPEANNRWTVPDIPRIDDSRSLMRGTRELAQMGVA